MAGIGDYVHARRSTYRRSGLSLYGNNPPPSAQEIYNNQITRIREEARRTKFNNPNVDRQQIERWLNMFFSPQNRTNLRNNQLSQTVINRIQAAVELYISNHFQHAVTLHPNNLSVSSSNAIFNVDQADTELLQAINRFHDVNDIGGKSSIQALITRIQTLIEFRDQLGQQNFNNSRIYNELATLESDLAQLEQAAYNYAERNSTSGAFIPVRNLPVFRTEDSRTENLAHKLNRIINLLKTGSIANVVGEYGEVIVKATNYVANVRANASVGQILNYLEQSFQNKSTSNKGVSSDFLSFYAIYPTQRMSRQEYEQWQKKFNDDQGQWTVNMTQDKVDATITVNPELENLNLSIKNYDLGSRAWLTILTGRNLLGLVQEYTSFVNHFLNIVGTHEGEDFERYEVAQMHQAMKISAFLKAIAGGVITQNGRNEAADLFVVNDNSQTIGGYRVYFLSDLLNNVINDITLITISNYPEGIWMQNRWVGNPIVKDRKNAAIRISTMVNVLRNMSLHISISRDALTQ